MVIFPLSSTGNKRCGCFGSCNCSCYTLGYNDGLNGQTRASFEIYPGGRPASCYQRLGRESDARWDKLMADFKEAKGKQGWKMATDSIEEPPPVELPRVLHKTAPPQMVRGVAMHRRWR